MPNKKNLLIKTHLFVILLSLILLLPFSQEALAVKNEKTHTHGVPPPELTMQVLEGVYAVYRYDIPGYDYLSVHTLIIESHSKKEGKMTVILGELGGKPNFRLGPIHCESLLTLKDRTLTAEQSTCGVSKSFYFDLTGVTDLNHFEAPLLYLGVMKNYWFIRELKRRKKGQNHSLVGLSATLKAVMRL